MNKKFDLDDYKALETFFFGGQTNESGNYIDGFNTFDEYLNEYIDSTNYELFGIIHNLIDSILENESIYEYYNNIYDNDFFTNIPYWALNKLVKKFKSKINDYVNELIKECNEMLASNSMRAEEIIKDNNSWEIAKNLMCSDICDELHFANKDISKIEFLMAYLEEHIDKYNQKFCCN